MLLLLVVFFGLMLQIIALVNLVFFLFQPLAG
jgi:hypothetical protein